ncbi:fungal-specific transcription factor domain-containing protein [Xylariales sp. AK1849]|nr:fungal-specific transcription factor domain-containing protein [Xylariales sp. AK1849]
MSYVPDKTTSVLTSGALGALVALGVPASALSPEKSASAGASLRSTATTATYTPVGTTGLPAPKLRSCICCSTCRTRKVRCDKMSPCSNCCRARISCVFPSLDKPPRWARRLGHIANTAKASQDADSAGVNQVMDRLRSLEGLVKELSSQLEQAHTAVSESRAGSPLVNSPSSLTQERQANQHAESSPGITASNVQSQFGRLVLGDSNQRRYVSSGFWSRINDEMDAEGLGGEEYDSSEDEESLGNAPSTQELDRTPSERHAFLFRHSLSPPFPDLHDLHPLPSQIPFLLNVFSDNVNFMVQVVHIPTVNRMIRDLRGAGLSALTPANEALMFAIYYASITSMEEEDISTNFGSSKSELDIKYRVGLEHALAKADFLNVPDLVLVQAFGIFLALVRRHDSPRFVWMMTGLVIRMAQALGMHRDGSHFAHLTPFEVEMRRRMWWAVCLLDLRASEDQGMDLTIADGSFDTRMPLSINDVDIDPETQETPKEREGITDMTFALLSCGMCDVMRQMMVVHLKDGASTLDSQSRLLNELYGTLERTYLQYSNASGNIAYWVNVTIARLVIAKMTLITYLPVLFSSPSENFSDEIRTKLFVAAIEVAEYNHALNSEQKCRHWRWIFQTYTHWHAIVYLLMAATRRAWSPVVERAWVALHSSWLIPAQSNVDRNLRMWVPLRKLMAKARRHRIAELERLRHDPQAAQCLEAEDCRTSQPASSGPFPGLDSAECFRDRWRQLVARPPGPRKDSQTAMQHSGEVDAQSNSAPLSSNPLYSAGVSASEPGSGSAHLQSSLSQDIGVPLASRSYTRFPSDPVGWSDARALGSGLGAWLWADADPSVDVFANLQVEMVDLNMDVDGDVDWNNWVESARGMELSAEPPAGGLA